jgi:two-component system response regulator YesN
MQRILVVDSDRASAELLSLELRAYEILHAPTAARALALAEKKPPRLAIVECLLRDLSGLELLRRLKALIPGLPVVMMAPYDSDWIRTTVFQAGAHGYLIKPIDVAVLQGIVEAVLPRDASFGGGSGISADHALISQAVSFIEGHYSEPLSLTRISSYLGISKFALCRKFRSIRGVSFRDYLLHFRLTKARELLTTRRYTITEIAQMVGFSDLPRFDKVFRHATGSTPSAYRRTTLAALFRAPASAR